MRVVSETSEVGISRSPQTKTTIGSALRRFADCRRGNVSIIFGFTVIIMVVSVGGAVDIARWLHARSMTQAAIDSAVLAGGRMLQIKSDDPTAAIQSAVKFYNENVKGRLTLQNDTVAFAPTDNNTAFTASGNAYIATPFLAFAGVPELPLLRNSETDFTKAVLAVGGNSEQSVEISLMLDITGSMGGDKIADLKDAAKDLIDIVVWEDQSEYTSRIALVPFSEYVNVGTYANAVRGAVASADTSKSCTWSQTRTCGQYKFTDTDGTSRTYKISTCVSERTGTNKYNDVAPNAANGRVSPGYASTSGSCKPNKTIMPLTSNKATLKTAIDGYSADGYTAGHLGTAWAWYMLSPNWAYLWPTVSQPESYEKMSELNRHNQPKLRKIAILMTDGEYNTQHRNGVFDKNAGLGPQINSTSLNGSSTTQARELCKEMKKTGITVYSIGFKLGSGSTAETTLKRDCATDTTMYYPAENGEQLRQAFRDIALKISNLYLSK